MNNERLKKLAGITGNKVKESTKVTVTVPKVKLYEEVEFKALLKEFDLSGSINGNTNIASISAELDTKKASEDKLLEFVNAWLNKDAPVMEDDLVEGAFASITDVVNAVDAGRKVFWQTPDYVVSKDLYGEYNVVYRPWSKNPNTVGLFHSDGKTSDYKAEDFIVAEAAEEGALYVLKVAQPGSDKFQPQFSGIKKECIDEWRDTKHTWDKGSKHKIEKHVQESISEGYEFEVQGNYEGEWECVDTHDSREDALKSADTYRENEKGTRFRVKMVKVQESDNNNFIQSVDKSVDTLNDRMGVDKERKEKVTIPADVKSSITKRISELKTSIEMYDKKGYNDHSQKEKAIDCLEQILDNLSTNDLEGLKKAQIFFETLMSPITDLFPSKLVNWLAKSVPSLVKESEEYFNPEATAKWAEKLKDEIGGTAQITRDPSGSGALIFLINNGKMVDSNHSDADNPHVMTPENLSKIIEKYYRRFRSAGWRFDQPVNGKFAIGVTKGKEDNLN